MTFSVGKIKVRKHTCTYENITFDAICTMKQAKVLTDKELNKVLDVIHSTHTQNETEQWCY